MTWLAPILIFACPVPFSMATGYGNSFSSTEQSHQICPSMPLLLYWLMLIRPLTQLFFLSIILSLSLPAFSKDTIAEMAVIYGQKQFARSLLLF